MKNLDFILPTKTSAFSREQIAPHSQPGSSKSSEPFDSLMSRALAKPERRSSDEFSGSKKTSADACTSRSANSKTSEKRETSETESADASASPDDSKLRPEKIKKDGDEKSNGQTDKSSDSDAKGETQTTAASVAAPDAASDATMTVQTACAVMVIAEPVAAVSKLKAAGTPPSLTSISALPGTAKSEAAARGECAVNTAPVAEKIPDQPVGESAEGKKKIPHSASHSAKMDLSEGGAVAVDKLLEKPEIAADTRVNSAILTQDKALNAMPETGGISAAEQAVTMNNAEKADKVAGSQEQNLPGVAIIAASAMPPARDKVVSKAATPGISTEPSATVNLSASDRPGAATETATSSTISPSSQTELRVRALDRTHDIVALHAMRLKDAGGTSLEVVIKPGAGLQLSLQLKQNADGIEAQAVLHRGDFDQLKQHWPELQQRMEERGIRLASLTTTDNSGTGENSGNTNRQQRQDADQDPMRAGAFAEFALVGSASTTPAQRATSASAHRGWESWA